MSNQESDMAQQLWRDSRQKPPQTAARPRDSRGLAEASSLFGPRTSRARHRPTPARGANQQRLRAASRASWPPPSLAPTGKNFPPPSGWPPPSTTWTAPLGGYRGSLSGDPRTAHKPPVLPTPFAV